MHYEVEEYEKQHFPITPPTLSEVLLDRMHDLRLSQKALAEKLGMTAPRLSEIICGKKDPTYQQARTISKELGIDPSIVLAL